MAKYRLYKNNNKKSVGYNKYYAKKAAEGMVDCVRELAYEGKSVKIDNLGIFRVSMKSKGVADPNDFKASTDITSKWQVRPTGECKSGRFVSFRQNDDYASVPCLSQRYMPTRIKMAPSRNQGVICSSSSHQAKKIVETGLT